MSRSHPSDHHLLRWTHTGRGRKAAEHALHCSLCEQRLEALTELTAQSRARLTDALTPPTAFEDRLRERLSQRLLNQETLAVLADLIEVGPETSWLLLEPEHEEDDSNG